MEALCYIYFYWLYQNQQNKQLAVIPPMNTFIPKMETWLYTDSTGTQICWKYKASAKTRAGQFFKMEYRCFKSRQMFLNVE